MNWGQKQREREKELERIFSEDLLPAAVKIAEEELGPLTLAANNRGFGRARHTITDEEGVMVTAALDSSGDSYSQTHSRISVIGSKRSQSRWDRGGVGTCSSSSSLRFVQSSRDPVAMLGGPERLARSLVKQMVTSRQTAIEVTRARASNQRGADEKKETQATFEEGLKGDSLPFGVSASFDRQTVTLSIRMHPEDAARVARLAIQINAERGRD